MTAHSLAFYSFLTEMSRERQPRPQGSSNVYSVVDDDPYERDVYSIDVELNPAYKPAAEPLLSHNLGTEAPFSHISANEGVVTSDTPMDGSGVEEKIERVESRVEEEGVDTTYYTPMDAGEVDEEGVDATYYTPMDIGEVEEKGKGVQSRTVLKEAEQRNRAEGDGNLNWGAITLGKSNEADGSSGEESVMGEVKETASDEEDNTYTAYI